MLSCTPSPFISDHYIVKCEIKYKKDRPTEENITYHKISKRDTDAFLKDLVLTGVTDDLDLAMMIHVFQHELCRVLDKHTPILTRKLPARQPKPWFNEDIKEQKQKVQRRERIWRKYRETHQWLAFKAEKQQYRFMLKDAKTEAVSNIIMECDRDIKKHYQVIYNMTGKHSINPLPDSDSELGHMTYIDQSWSFKITTGHVTLQGKHN